MENFIKKNEAALILTPQNRRYFSGFNSSDGVLLITKKSRKLFVDTRYILAAKKASLKAEVFLLDNIKEQINIILSEESIEKVYLEYENTYYDAARFSKLNAKTVVSEQLSEYIKKLREVKSGEEMLFIKQSLNIAETALENTLKIVKPGLTEREVAAHLEYEMRKLGSEETAFSTICLTGAKSAMPHGETDDTVIKKGDALLFDFGATKNGYRSDISRTFFVGKPKNEFIKCYEAVLSSILVGEAVISAGANASFCDKAARNALQEYEPYFTHSLGHGVGLSIHEMPYLSKKATGTLKEGNVVTVEPGVYLEGKFGIRIEDMVAVFTGGNEVFTKFPKKLINLS